MTRDTLARRIFLILLIGAALSAAAALWLSDSLYRQRQADQDRSQAAARIAAALPVLRSGADVRGVARAAEGIVPGSADVALTRRLAETLGQGQAVAYQTRAADCVPPPPAHLPGRTPPGPPLPPLSVAPGSTAPAAPHPPVGPAEQNCRLIVAQTGQGTLALTTALPPPPAPLAADRLGLVFLGVMALAAALLAWIAARLAVQPLRSLSTAAAALGDDLDRPPLPLAGPEELRDAAAAFNTMQMRLKAALSDRTRMLAAITHDLQTPLTRMRLRLDKVTDAELRARLLADFAATQVLIREGLDLAREVEASEPTGQVDLPSLVSALVEDMADAGLPVRVIETCAAVAPTRPQALRRALGNLIDNAVQHGGAADVALIRDPSGDIAITVRDHGPGVPEDQLNAVLEPFHRLDASRSRDSGGAGLGLTIAQRMAARSGARLTLSNHPDGGLEARLVFAQLGPQNQV
ncbi:MULTISPECIES: ATP-binding protein [unclassified Brevundimonas]|uniref:ATP-binding protein n=1 Tax=unclassified Brevundimonas TaxID=2622653 RepID=UPI000E9BF1F5|nr:MULTISPECIES: ATP-binding protein [unclassified Brevundimonas]MCK6103399.1 HAMP domain-containing protein [Brevundimonas sp. EYE_349]HBI19658.1 two-component sensor histidine kinase [Brevundimonas sp.]